VAASGTGGAPVAHHFDNLRQQQSTVRFGMWIFLITEVLFFGGALCAYTVYRIWYPREFDAGSAALNVGIASVNTFLLLTSSLTITLAIRACYVGNQRALKGWLLATIVLGTAFLGLKMREYHLDYQEHLVPGTAARPGAHSENPLTQRTLAEEDFVKALRETLEREHYHYVETGPYAPTPGSPEFAEYEKKLEEARKPGSHVPEVNLVRVQLFFMFYYCLTGLHVAHMVVGIGLLLWQYILAARGFFRFSERYVYVEVMSLYWHFVDMVWIFLLPLLYLAGPHNLSQAGRQFQLALGLVGH
jgi:cytochrome c oxidase subunit III